METSSINQIALDEARKLIEGRLTKPDLEVIQLLLADQRDRRQEALRRELELARSRDDAMDREQARRQARRRLIAEAFGAPGAAAALLV
ncbi:MAG: hypothetical protein GMKNLPBB_00816 [Myxococcota bacterium]|nr:hypothetical protein [Myxococcota bacterium]